MCLMLDQFLWGHSSRVCDISCFCSKSGHVAYQIKVEQGNTLNLHTPLTSGVGFKGQILKVNILLN